MSGTGFGGGPEETCSWHASTLPCLLLLFCPTGCSPCSWSASSWLSAYLWLLQSSTSPSMIPNSSTSCCYMYFLRRPIITLHMHWEGFSLWSANSYCLLHIPLTPSVKQQWPWHANQLLSAEGTAHERGSLQGLGRVGADLLCSTPVPLPQTPTGWALSWECPWMGAQSLCLGTPVHMAEEAIAVLFVHLWGSALLTFRV